MPSDLNGADGLTKPKDPELFYTFKSLIWILEINESIELIEDIGGQMDL